LVKRQQFPGATFYGGPRMQQIMNPASSHAQFFSLIEALQNLLDTQVNEFQISCQTANQPSRVAGQQPKMRFSGQRGKDFRQRVLARKPFFLVQPLA